MDSVSRCVECFGIKKTRVFFNQEIKRLRLMEQQEVTLYLRQRKRTGNMPKQKVVDRLLDID